MYSIIAIHQDIQKWGIKKYASDETTRGLHPEDSFSRLDRIVKIQAGWGRRVRLRIVKGNFANPGYEIY